MKPNHAGARFFQEGAAVFVMALLSLPFSVEAPGSVVTDGKEGCADGTTAYSASLPLAEFSSKVAAPSPGTTPAAAVAAPAPQQKPMLLSVVDKSGRIEILRLLRMGSIRQRSII